MCKSIKYEESQDQCEFIEIIVAFALFKNSYLISEIIIFYGIDNLGHTQINV